MDYSIFALIFFAYCLGSISSAVFICKLFVKPDPRTHGSGNPGATNVLRIAGKPYAVMVLLFDILKGAIPVGIALGMGFSPQLQTAVGLFAILGHMFPIFMRFKGGKGVATALGFLCIFSPLLTAVLMGCFALVVATTRMVSLASITAALAAPGAYYFLNNGELNWSLLLMGLLITAKHHSNIARIVKGTENKI